MDPFYQIENNIPSNIFNFHRSSRNETYLYVFVKGAYPNYMDLDYLTDEWSLRGYNSRASFETRWGNENNNWINWSYYMYTGPLSSRPLAESILYQHFINLKNSEQIIDFRIRDTFVVL